MTLAIKPHGSRQLNPQSLWQPVQVGIAGLKRIWWHGQALTPILAIMLLVLSSLAFLFFHSLFHNPLKTAPKNGLKQAESVD